MTHAIILAAGQGTRLRPLTHNKPKCLVPLLGKTLLERQAKTLNRAGISDIRVVGGFMIHEIQAAGYPCVENKAYESTNMVASLFCAQEFMVDNEDLIIGYGDIVYQTNNLLSLLKSSADISIMIDQDWRRLWELRFENPLTDAETLILNDRNEIISLGKKPQSYDQIQGQYTGLIKVRGDKIADFKRFYNTQDFSNQYMTDFLQALIDAKWKVHAVMVNNGWLEVDSVHDLETYEALNAQNKLSSYYIPDV